jgi:hypothetical protein
MALTMASGKAQEIEIGILMAWENSTMRGMLHQYKHPAFVIEL